MRKRLLALLLAFVMVLGMLPTSIALAEEADVQTLWAAKAAAITEDNVLSEQEWTATAAFSGDLTGSLSAAWDKDKLYLGVSAPDAAQVSVTLGEETVSADLVSGAAELALPWSEAGVSLYDYGQIVSGLTAQLTGDTGTASLTADVVISGVAANDIDLASFTAIGNGVTKSADQVVWDTPATDQQSRIYKANMALVDHSKDMLFTQTVKIDRLPARTGVINTTHHHADGCYFFTICDYNDNGKQTGDTVANDNGSAVQCVIYADENGNLYLRLRNDVTQDAVENAGTALNRKLGDTFQLAVLWRADDSVAVYVDGETVLAAENGTLVHSSGMGNKAIMLWYYNAKKAADATAALTVSDVTLSVSGEASVLDDLTAAALLGDVDLTNVMESLTLPATYANEVFGEIPLTWTSSDETVLANDGTINRPQGLEGKTVQLTLSVGGTALWTVDVTVAPAAASSSVTAVCADEITVDNVLDEAYWVNYSVLKPSADGAPTGSAALAYNRNGLYVGLKYANAETLTVNLNGKTETVTLDGSGLAEVLLPWTDFGVTLTDYYQEIPGFQVTLENADGTAVLANGAANLIPTAEKVNHVAPNAMTKHGNTAEISATENEIIWNTTSAGHSKVYRQNYAFVDHSRDLLLTQTIHIENMPASTGVINSTHDYANDTYYFWMSDYNDKGTDDGVTNNSGTAVFGVVYADADGNLYFRFRNDIATDAAANAGTALNRKIGDTFQLSVLWRADDSAVAYVDGEAVLAVENGTLVKTSGLGAKCLQFLYKNGAAKADAARLTVSNISVTGAEVTSVREEITVESVLGSTDLTAVIDDLELPETYESPYLGSIPLTWESSDETVLGSDGTVYPPDNDEGTDAQLTLYVNGETVWTVDVHVASASAEVIGPVPASPAVITAAFSAEEIVVDGIVDEQGWVLSTRVLDSENMVRGKFGVQWQKDTLFLAVKARSIGTATLTVNGKTITINWSDLTVTGDFHVSAIAKKNAFVELAIPFEQLGVTVDRYDIRLPITVALDAYTYSGEVNLDSVDWFVADNEYRPLPASTKGTVKYLGTAPVEGYQGYEQITDGWRVYDLYNPDGNNPAGVRTYVIMMKDAEFEPMADRSSTIYVEFDFHAKSMPVYDVSEDSGWAGNFASYGFTWWLADDDDSAKNANSVSFGIINTDEGLTFVALRDSGSIWSYALNKQVGDLFRIGTGWKTNGDVVLYVDGQEAAVIEGVESLRNGFGDKSLAFNLIRNLKAAASEEDNFDISFTNIAAGHAMENSLLEALNWAAIRGENTAENNVTSALTLPAELSDSQLGLSQKLTWTSSDESVLAADGTVTRPETGAVEVTLTATLEDGSSKVFHLRVMGLFNSSGNVLVLTKDYDPANGVGAVIDAYDFALDADNSSVIIDLLEKQTVTVAALKDGDSFARLNEEVLTLWVSDDNVTYTRVKDFKLLHQGEIWYLYDFAAEGRYVKIHCTHFDGEEADLVGPVAEIITAYNDPYLANGGSFTETTVSLTNDTGIERYDYAWTLDTEAQRVLLDGELLYHYVENGKTIVRVPYLADGETVELTILSGNSAALDTANKEYVYEVTYGTREMHDVGGNPRWVLQLDNGVLMGFTEGGRSLYRGFSYDNGYTWTTMETIPCSVGLFSETSGFTVDSHTGRIYVHGHLVDNFTPTDMEKSKAVINMIYSDDQGQTWTYLGEIDTDGTYSVTYTNGIELSCYDGEGPNVDFVYPTGQQYNNTGAFCARVLYSTDAGLTWQVSEDKIIYDEGASFEGGVSECTIQERSDGVLVLYGRNQGAGIDNFAKTYSYDHGITWVTPAVLSSVYTVNTQPIMFRYNDAILLTWGGNNMLGGESRIRTPYNIAITYDEMETFENIQDIYVKYSLQGLTASTMNRITNQSVTVTEDDTLVTTWMNLADANSERTEVLMRVEDFHNFFYRTKGAYDSFEHGTVRYEGWEPTGGDVTLSDAYASDGSYSMQVSGGTVARSIPYIQNGTVELDVYVDGSQSFTVDLQSAYTNLSGKGAPVGVTVENNAVTFLGADAASGLTLQQGWNTLVFELNLTEGKAQFSLNGGSFTEMPVNLTIGDYVCFITVIASDVVWVDNVLVEDDQDAVVPGAESEQKPELYGSSMTLGNDLSMNFYMEANKVPEGAYAEITFKGETVQAELVLDESGNYYVASYTGIAAKEMTDELTVVIRDADGNAVSSVWTDSIRAYAMRMLEKDNTAELNTVLVDMLNYGAEAQKQFGYRTDDLANSLLTDAQKALATQSVTMTDSRVKGDNYYGSSLALESQIQLIFYFSGVKAGTKATVTYTNHYGEEVTLEKTVVMNGRYAQVIVSELAVADADALVTCTLSDGSYAADSVESYCARMESLALREPLMKFARSAYNHFHPEA